MLNKYCYYYSDFEYGIIYNSMNGEIRLYKKEEFDKIIIGKISDSKIYSDLENNDFFECSKSHNFYNDTYYKLQNLRDNSSYLRIRIFTTTKCNAQCFYCYEKNSTKKNMDNLLADCVIEYVKKIVEENNYKNLHIEWFGGEPFLNFNIIKHILYRFKSELPYIKIESSIVTNGILINDEKIRFLKDEANIKTVQITLDGTKETYERIKLLGEGSFEKILSIIKKLVDQNILVLIRLNYNDENIEEIKELIKFLGKKDFSNKILVGCNPIFNDDSKEDSIFLKTKYIEDIIRTLYNAGFLSLKNIMPKRRYYPCVAKTQHYLSFYVDGNVYACDRSFSNEMRFDNVLEPSINKNINEELCKISEKCKVCKYFPVCYGGCEYERTIGKSGCDYNDQIMESHLKFMLEKYKEMVGNKYE